MTLLIVFSLGLLVGTVAMVLLGMAALGLDHRDRERRNRIYDDA